MWYRSTTAVAGSPPRADGSLSNFVSEIFSSPPTTAAAGKAAGATATNKVENIARDAPPQTTALCSVISKTSTVVAAATAATTSAARSSKPSFFINDASSSESDEDDLPATRATTATKATVTVAPAPPVLRAPVPTRSTSTTNAAAAAASTAAANGHIRMVRRDPILRNQQPSQPQQSQSQQEPSLFCRSDISTHIPKCSSLSNLIKKESSPAKPYYLQPFKGNTSLASSSSGPAYAARPIPTSGNQGAAATSRLLECSESLRQGLLLDRKSIFNFGDSAAAPTNRTTGFTAASALPPGEQNLAMLEPLW